MKIFWAITGAGHRLEETISFMEKIANKTEITVALSTAGLEVAKVYGLLGRIKKISQEIILERDQGASYPVVGRLAKKQCSILLVAPCTANTVAKVAHGIADSLVTNLVAQAVKNKTKVMILPTDFQKREITKTPQGDEIILHLRTVDIENVKRVEKMEGVKVVKKLEEVI